MWCGKGCLCFCTFKLIRPILLVRKTPHPLTEPLFILVGLGFLRGVPFEFGCSSNERPPSGAVSHFRNRIWQRGSLNIDRGLVHILMQRKLISLRRSLFTQTFLRFLNRSSTRDRHSSDGIAGFLELQLVDGSAATSTDASGIAYGLSTLVIRGSKFASRLQGIVQSTPMVYVTPAAEHAHTLQ